MRLNKLYLILFFAGCFSLIGCSSAPMFLKKAPAEPTMKAFPKANAVVVLRHIQIKLSDDGTEFERKTHVQIKALNRYGLKAIKSVATWYNKHLKIVEGSFHARLIRPNGWISKSSHLFDVPSGRIRSASSFTDARFKATSFRDLVPGSVLEYYYTHKGPSWMLAPMLVQSDIPVVKMVLEVSAPAEAQYKIKLYGGSNYSKDNIKTKNGSNEGYATKIWTAKNVPAVPSEAAMPARDSVSARIHFVTNKYKVGKYEGLGRSWNDIAAFYSKFVEKRDQPTPTISGFSKNLTKDAKDDKEKARLIYDFVRKEIRYIAVGIDLGGWQPQAADYTLKQRYGDCKAKSTLMVAMLKSVGIKAHQVLVRTKNRGAADHDFPSDYGVFNHVINYLPSIDGGRYVDATTTSNKFELLRQDDQGASGLIIDGQQGKIVTIPAFKASENIKHRKLTLKLVHPKKKNVSGTLVYGYGGVARVPMDGLLESKKLKDQKERTGWAKKQFRFLGKDSFKHGSLKISKVSFSGQKSKVLKATISFTAKLHKKLSRRVLPINIGVLSFRFNDSLRAERKAHPVVWSNRYSFVREYAFYGWMPLDYPKNLSLKDKNVSYSHAYKATKKSLTYKQEVSFPSTLIKRKDFEEFRKHFDKVDARNNRLVLLAVPKKDKPKDRDKDGVIDKLDKCPDIPGLKEKNGCPRVVLVKKVGKTIQILKKIFFSRGRAKIKRKSLPILDQVAQVLASNPELKIEIQGHTDSRGSQKYNTKLSDRRAKAVMSYLVKKKVPKESMSAKGFGPEKPIADNKKRAGRAKNRRVEFQITNSK